jgi:hypothetical protein
MPKYICAGAIPYPGIFRYFCHANPDRLEILTTRAHESTANELSQIALEFSNIMHDIRIRNVWKRTEQGRLPKTEESICQFIREPKASQSTKRTSVRILDLGASDGSTTKDLLNAVQGETSRSIEIYLGDLYLRLLRFRNRYVVEYRSSYGDPVMVRIGRIGLRLPRSEHWWDWISNLIARWYFRCHDLRLGMVKEVELFLVHPNVAEEPPIKLVEMNCLEWKDSLKDMFDVVRASNVLILDYFTAEQIQRVLDHLHGYIRKGGCLVVSRNIGGPGKEVEEGSVWRHTDNGFKHMEDFGNGSEVKNLVDEFCLSGSSEDISLSSAV